MRAPSLAQANRTPTNGPEHDMVYETAEALNELQDEELKQLVVNSLSQPQLRRSRRKPLAYVITANVIGRVYSLVGKLEQRGGLNHQAALARVINDLMHGNLSDVESLETCGNDMWKTAVCRHGKCVKKAKERVRKARTEAGRLVNSTELAALHLAHYTCPWGATTNDRRSTPAPVRTADPLAAEVLKLRREATSLLSANNELKQKADSSKRDRERADIADATAADALEQLKVALVAAAAAAVEAAVELASDLVERAEGKAERAEGKAKAATATLEIQITARKAAMRKAAQAATDQRGAVAKAAGQVVAAYVEAERAAEARLSLEADFEAAVERRLHQEKPQLREELEAEYAEQIAEAEEASVARKRREKAERRRALQSATRLTRAQAAEEQVEILQAQIETLREKVQGLAVEEEAASDEDAPSAEGLRDRSGRRIGKFDWTTRRLFHRWLARRTPPAQAGQNYMDAAKHFAPQQKTRQPSLEWIRALRAETTILGEACAALQVLCAKRIISFGFDESTKRGDGVASTNIQIETGSGEILDVVMRGAFVIPGGTAEQVSDAMESKLFAHGRKLLRRWKEIYEKMGGTWPFPDPSRLGYHQLGGALIMSDTCNAARAAKRLIMANAAAAIEADIGAAAWALLSVDEKTEKTRCYVGDCMQHLRNILLDAMTAKATKHLQLELEESLNTFSSYERMSTDVMQLIRAVYKELHHTGEYAKGKQREFEHWLLTNHPSAFFMPLERANGGRQDLAFDGSVPIYANRGLICEFLHTLVFVPGHSNILEDFIWHSLACVEMVALTRALTLFDLLLSMPLRWLCGKGSELDDWSVYKAAGSLDLVEELLVKAAANGAVLFDPDLDVFASIAEEQQLFRTWRKELASETVASPDKTKPGHAWFKRVLGEAQSPTNESNKAATDATIDLIEAMAVAGLAKMRDPRIAIADWLTSQDGSKSIGKNAAAHAATVGAHVTNCRVESNFGGFDNVLRTFEGICIENASGIAQQMRMHHFDSRTDHCIHNRKVKPDAKRSSSSVGFFDSLSEMMQEAGVEMARVMRPEARATARADRKEQAEYRALARAQNLQCQLDALATKGSLGLERFQEYANGQAVFKPAEAAAALAKIDAQTNKQAFLRSQIEMRVNGLGWSDLATTWQSTGESLAQSVSRLTGHLKEVLVEESVRTRRGEVVWEEQSSSGEVVWELVKPSEAALPDFEAKSRKQLGTRTADATSLAARALCSPEQIAAASQRERERREAAGFTDAVQMTMPKAPILPLVVGTQLEVCWGKYRSTVDGSTLKMWCPCKVLRVADGENDKGMDGKPLSSAARKLAPRGMVLIEWEPDSDRGETEATSMWLLLDPRPGKWNGDGHRAWRYHPNKLAEMQRSRTRAKQPRRANDTPA